MWSSVPVLGLLVLGGPAHALTVGAPVPGRAGRDNAVLVTGARPGDTVFLVLGAPGGGPIQVCPGLATEVQKQSISGPVVANAQGEATFVVPVPAGAEGRASGLQAFVRATCTLSPPQWHTWPALLERWLGDADAIFLGVAAYDGAGYDVAGAGDVDADGFDDVLVVADNGGYGTGVTYLLRGPMSNLIDLADADALMVAPPTPSDGSTREAAGVGDVNGDGFDELLVGGPISGSNAGTAYLLHGPVSGTFHLENRADAMLLGEGGDDAAGSAVGSAGDVDGDGFPDLLIGAAQSSRAGDSSGAAYVVSGLVSGMVDLSAANVILVGEGPEQNAGWSVASAGDADGDGVGDILAGAPGYEIPGDFGARGAVYLVHGPLSGTLSLADADARMIGALDTETAGYDVSGGRDLDADGVPEILVGAPQHPLDTDAGAAYVVKGDVSGDRSLADADAVLLGVQQRLRAGADVASVADVNDDGFDDILVGSQNLGFGDQFGDHGAYLVLGPVSGTMILTDADGVFVDEHGIDMAGWGVADAGDTNADGLGDLIIGAPDRNRRGVRAMGGAYLILGGLGY